MAKGREDLGLPLEAPEPIGVVCEQIGRTLSATSRSRLVSRGRYNSPILPAPDGVDDLSRNETGARTERHEMLDCRQRELTRQSATVRPTGRVKVDGDIIDVSSDEGKALMDAMTTFHDAFPKAQALTGGRVVLTEPRHRAQYLTFRETTVQGGQQVDLELPWATVLSAQAIPLRRDRSLWDDAEDISAYVGLDHRGNRYFRVTLLALTALCTITEIAGTLHMEIFSNLSILARRFFYR